MTGTGTNRLAWVAARIGLTEGQAYTVAIVLVVVLLLVSSLTRWTPIEELAARSSNRPSPAAPPVPPGDGPTLTVPTIALSPLPPLAPLPVPSPLAPPRGTSHEPDAAAEEPPCGNAAVVASARDLIGQLDALVGGVAPSGTLVSVIVLATGCSQADPTVLLLAALIEVGDELPSLGLETLELPVLPFVELPVPVVDVLQPFRAALDGICGTVSVLGIITSQVGPHYPAPLNAVFAVSLFYATATCGQIQNPVPASGG